MTHFRTRKDGKHFPIGASGNSMDAFLNLNNEDQIRQARVKQYTPSRSGNDVLERMGNAMCECGHPYYLHGKQFCMATGCASPIHTFHETGTGKDAKTVAAEIDKEANKSL